MPDSAGGLARNGLPVWRSRGRLAGAGALAAMVVYALWRGWGAFEVAHGALLGFVVGAAVVLGLWWWRAPLAAVGAARLPVQASLTAEDVLAALPDAALLLESADRVSLTNAAARTLLPLVVAGEGIYAGMRDPDVLEALDAARRSGQTRTTQFRIATPIDRHFEVLIAPIPRRGADDPVLLVVFRERTEAIRLDRMRADFVAHASHELRTPLASLLGFVETLQGPARNDTAARDRFLGIMREQAQRMARLIDDLLSLSRIELNQHLRPTERLQLTPLIRHIFDTLGPLAQSEGVTLTFDPAGYEQAEVLGDRDELLRVFENLVENAIKYGADGKRVDVTIRQQEPGRADSPQIVVSIRDYGPGIAAEHLPRLTERFYRVDAGDSRAKGGTGLGLAIVKHIVARHTGRLVIESTAGDGADFRVQLPLA